MKWAGPAKFYRSERLLARRQHFEMWRRWWNFQKDSLHIPFTYVSFVRPSCILFLFYHFLHHFIASIFIQIFNQHISIPNLASIKHLRSLKNLIFSIKLSKCRKQTTILLVPEQLKPRQNTSNLKSSARFVFHLQVISKKYAKQMVI